MKKFTLALGMAVLGAIISSPKVLAEKLNQPEPILIAQTQTQLKPQLQLPSINPQFTHTYNSGNSNNIESLLNQATEYLQNGNYDQVIENCNQILQQDKDNYGAYILRGLAYIQIEKYQPAVDDFNQAIRIEPNSHYSYFGRGYAYLHLKDYEQSLADFNQAIKLDSDFAHAYFWRGIAQGNLGNKQGAVADLKQAAELYKREGKTENMKTALDLLKQIS
ncbi:tetratricopeptide repeat protein [Calothrix sp. FACHB-1219]|uniref:tetratricopeptide repeat protein n=1 Tax=unclassified Calothrix TaxID=2619626 RepID=UPI001681F63C|nr:MULTISPECIES: tetratricopeptide repeat protein [unclassified Calothrix]MBD2206958.1 tetratricopeptide repeat protein [Calothrix sp. FACHB-168]MBD2221456.1 tetratricopeptide repeat protein [Calothrix sp. FACHB-1219]